MRDFLAKFIAAACGALACVGVLGTPPAVASSITYTVDARIVGFLGLTTVVTGSIITDGFIGALQPENILGWNLTETNFNFSNPGNIFGVVIYVSDSGGTLSWPPGSLSATPTELYFNFETVGQFFTASLIFNSPNAPCAGCTFSFTPYNACGLNL